MRPLLVTLLPTALALPSFPFTASVQRPLPLQATTSEISCPLAPKIDPDSDGFLSSLHLIQDNEIRERQVERLSRAVQVDTSVGDSVTDPNDEGFAPFVDFQRLLRELFPLVYVCLMQSPGLNRIHMLNYHPQPLHRPTRPHKHPRAPLHPLRHLPTPPTNPLPRPPGRRPHRRPNRLDIPALLRPLRRNLHLGPRGKRLQKHFNRPPLRRRGSAQSGIQTSAHGTFFVWVR